MMVRVEVYSGVPNTKPIKVFTCDLQMMDLFPYLKKGYRCEVFEVW